VWQQLSGSRVLVLQNSGVYEQLVLQPSSSEHDIIRDIGRTFPAHVAYQQRNGAGQRALYNVLKAYAVYDKEVGYVQGMGFVAATALLYMGEEDTFWLLVALLKGAMHTPMEGLYQQVKKAVVALPDMHAHRLIRVPVRRCTDLWKATHPVAVTPWESRAYTLIRPRGVVAGLPQGLPLVQQYQYQFERLLQEFCPPLGDHLRNESIHPSMYCSQVRMEIGLGSEWRVVWLISR
jgi:hypothetical protein